MIDFKIIKYISKAFSGSNNRKFADFIRGVAFTSIFLGSLSLILSLSVLEGFDKALRENASKFSAHILINSFTKQPLYNYNEAVNQLKSEIPEIKFIQPVIEREGLVKSKYSVDGILVRGIFPNNDITGIANLIKAGKFAFSSEDAKEVIISKRLADKLNCKLNEGLILFGLDGDSYMDIPEPKIGKFKIVGIYESGMAKYDNILVYMPFKSAAKFFSIPDNSASVLEIMLEKPEFAPAVSNNLDNLLKYPFYSTTIYDLHQAMFSWIELQKEPIPLVLGLISIVAVLNIITALLIIVVEKTKTIGILRSLGLNNMHLLAVFLYQGLKIGFWGTFAGVGSAFILSWLQINYHIVKLKGEIYFLDFLPMDITLWHYQIVISLSLFFTFIATLIPAFIAVKLKPVNAIRFK